ncbi:MAG: FAD-dependent monooxygenase, partial [Myxococcota bacterium]
IRNHEIQTENKGAYEMRVDVAIVGAGVAGAALAASLGRAGLRVALVERREDVPETIAGELLQPGGVQALEQLQLREALTGIDAQEVKGFAIFEGVEGQALAYPTTSKSQEHGGKVHGYAFHHHRFVAHLREIALRNPKVTWCLGHVVSLHIHEQRVHGLTYRDRNGEHHTLEAALTVAADGRGSKLRYQLSQGAAPEKVSYSIGVTLREACLPFSHHGHVFLTAPAPTLAYQIGKRTIRLLIDHPGTLPNKKNGAMNTFLREQIKPQLPASMQPALEQAMACGDYQMMQNLRMSPPSPSLAGAALIGDAYNMRHPMTGSGMTVALNDVNHLVSLLQHVDLHDTQTLDRCIQQFYRKRERLAVTLDMLAGALYEIFCAEDTAHALMRDAVLRYWQLGGIAISGPMSLLSGMRPNPLMLLAHFFAVALVEAGQRTVRAPLHPRKLFSHMKEVTQLISGALTTIRPQLQRGLQLFLPSNSSS